MRNLQHLIRLASAQQGEQLAVEILNAVTAQGTMTLGVEEDGKHYLSINISVEDHLADRIDETIAHTIRTFSQRSN